MRSISSVLSGSAALTVLMQLANWFFEAVGSVPDIEGCGFLAGGLGILAVIYPGLAAAVTYGLSRSRPNPCESPIRCALAGVLGAGAYLIVGIVLAVSREHYGALSLPALAWAAAYVALAGVGALAGSKSASLYGARLAVSDSRG
jgi:hypothetical protein